MLGMKKKKFKITIKDIIQLILLIIIPYILIILILYPYAYEVHGELTSTSDAKIIFYENNTTKNIKDLFAEKGNGHYMEGEGHFTGDVYFGEGYYGFSGWVICNGRITFDERIIINNANFSYEYKSREITGGGGGSDYSWIKFHGKEGEMENGFPYYYLGLLGAIFGLLFWIIKIFLKQKKIRPNLIYYSIFSFIPIIILPAVIHWFCISFVAISLGLLITFIFIFKRNILYFHFLNYCRLIFLLGLFVLIISIIIFSFPALLPESTRILMKFGLIGIFISIYPINIGLIPRKKIQKLFKFYCYNCKNKVKYSTIYKSWFCDQCYMYVPIHNCTHCYQQLKYNKKSQQWFCSYCKKY